MTSTTSAIAYLESQGYDLSSVRAELRKRELAAQACQPTELELVRGKYSTPVVMDLNQQKPVVVNGQDPVEVYRILGCDTLHEGTMVRLTSGQRTVLRTRYGMTPTALVEVVGFETYPSWPAIVSAVTIRSLAPAEHRTKVLSMVRIERFGVFLELAAQLTQEAAQASGRADTGSGESKSAAKKRELQARIEQLAEEYA